MKITTLFNGQKKNGFSPANNTITPRALIALASLLFLVQAPHVFHLPAWVSALVAIIILGRLALLRFPDQKALNRLLSAVFVTTLSAVSALLIYLDYGYLIGRDPSVAFLAILVAAKFAETRHSKDVTTLICMASFLLLTQYFYSQTIIAALFTVPAVIALAYTLALVRAHRSQLPASQFYKLAIKLLIQGIPIAAVLFITFPRLPGPLWSLPEDSIATTGLSDSMTPGSIGQLTRSDAVAFRVEFDGAVPLPNERYWRGPVLTEFNGRSWNLNPIRMDATPSYQGEAKQRIGYTVMLQPHQQKWLFALDAAVTLPQPSAPNESSLGANRYASPLGQLLSDGQIVTPKPISQVFRYYQESVLSQTIPEPYIPSKNTLFTPGINRRTQTLATQLRKKAGNDVEYANAVMRYFNHEPFHYTLKPQILGSTPIDEFLFDSRAGFCEHFASAFVVLMRNAGIPARVVTGYLGGEMNGDYMIVRQSDAHAWAEAYLNGAWHRYDPTGAVAPSRIEQSLSAALPNETSIPRMARLNNDWFHRAQLHWDTINHQWQRWVVDFDSNSQDRLWQRFGFVKPSLITTTLLVLFIAALWAIIFLFFLQRQRQPISLTEQYWHQLQNLIQRHHLQRATNETPTEFLQRAAERWPKLASSFSRINSQFTQLRFQALPPAKYASLQQDVNLEIRKLRFKLISKRF